MGKRKYGVPLGKSGCRFVVGDVSRGDLQSFQFSRGGWGKAVRFAWEQARRSSFMPLIDIACAKGYPKRMPLMQCSRNRETDGVRCEPEIFSMTEGEEPIAGLRRRSQRGKRR
jgi:hypothetical protein